MKPSCLKNYESMEKELQSISFKYFAAKREEKKKRLCENNVIDSNILLLYSSRVHSAFFDLTDEEKMIINRDFFYEDHKDWWISLFNKKTYLTKKKRAMEKFLINFYEID